MRGLVAAIAKLTEHRNRDDLARTFTSLVKEAADAKAASTWRVDISDSDVLPFRLADDRSGEADRAQLPESSDSALRETAMRQLPQLFRDNQGFYHHAFPVTDEKAGMVVLELTSRELLSTSKLTRVGNLVKIYRNHVRILDESEHDTLTGLRNRKSFDEYFHARVNAHCRSNGADCAQLTLGRRRQPKSEQRLWLGVIDIDHFKSINDRFGHSFGDEVLILVARLLRSNLRDSDLVFRFGGEEFVVLLSPTDEQSAEVVFDRLRKSIEQFAFPQVGRVTISIGYTKLSPIDSGAEAFGRADVALYAVKNNGRNAVLCHERLELAANVMVPATADDGLELF